jgi:peroxin-19
VLLCSLLCLINTHGHAHHTHNNPNKQTNKQTAEFQKLQTSLQQQLKVPTPTATPASATATASSSSSSGGADAKEAEPVDFQAAMAQTLKMMQQGEQQATATIGPQPAKKGGDDMQMMEALLGDVMKSIGGAGAAGANGGATGGPGLPGNMDSMLEKMMGEMMSKENLYAPLSEMANKYPGWLRENKATLTSKQYADYESQHAVLKQILATFDSEPENKTKVMTLMQDMQKFGQPPQAICSDMLPPGMQMGGAGGNGAAMPENMDAMMKELEGMAKGGGPGGECAQQ